jgi:hypothetical protein
LLKRDHFSSRHLGEAFLNTIQKIVSHAELLWWLNTTTTYVFILIQSIDGVHLKDC